MIDVLEKVRRLVNCDLNDPFEVLGPHQVSTSRGNRLAIRVYAPGAREIRISDARDRTKQYLMKEVHEAYFFEYVFENEALQPFPYQLHA